MLLVIPRSLNPRQASPRVRIRSGSGYAHRGKRRTPMEMLILCDSLVTAAAAAPTPCFSPPSPPPFDTWLRNKTGNNCENVLSRERRCARNALLCVTSRHQDGQSLNSSTWVRGAIYARSRGQYRAEKSEC